MRAPRMRMGPPLSIFLLALLLIFLLALLLLLLLLLLLELLCNGDNSGTAEEGPSHTISQYTAPPPPLLRLHPSSDDVLTQGEQ